MVASYTVGIAFLERSKTCQKIAAECKGGPRQTRQRSGASSKSRQTADRKETARSNRRRFGKAVALLRFFVRYLEATSTQRVTERELVQIRQHALTQEREQLQLRRRLSRVFPSLYQATIVTKHKSRAEQFVHRTLDRIHQDYAKPITLKHCADQLALHPAYLCRLFSQIVGLPFKTYLTDLRFEKARQLLSDPACRVQEVAEAVGFDGANQFRAAFKKATGLSPSAWRQAFGSSGPAVKK